MKRFDTIFTEIRPCSSSMNSRISSQELWRQTPWAPTDTTWSKISSFDCRNTLTNTAAWPPTVLGDGTRRPARRHVALRSLQVQRRPRAATTHPLVDQQGFTRAHPLMRKRQITNSCETDPDVNGNAVVCSVFGQCRCQKCVDGCCNVVFLGSSCVNVHKSIFSQKYQRIWTIYDKHTHAFFTQKRLF